MLFYHAGAEGAAAEQHVAHIDTPQVDTAIRHATNGRRVVTFQADGDELDAIIWGLANYTKPTH